MCFKKWLGNMALVLLAACSSPYQAPVDTAGEPLFLNAGRQHLINQGETLYAVAWMYDLDPNALARANNLREPYTLTAGQYLMVDLRGQSGSSAVTASPAAPTGRAPGTSAVTAVNPVQVGRANTTQRTTLPPSERPSRAALPPEGTTAAPVAPANPPQAAARPVPAPTASPPQETPTTRSTSVATTADSATVNWGWPHRGNIVGRFSDGSGDNKGIDIAGNEGDAVLAAADGEVVYSGSGLLRYGNLLIIKHNDHYLSAYAHNRALLVGEKAKVTRGQKIAELGSSGIDRNMLHFEIRVDGKPSDPLQFLPKP